MTSKIANQVRVLRAQLKRDLKARRASIGALLRDPRPVPGDREGTFERARDY